MKEEWLFYGAVVPIDVETTAALVAEIKRLIDVIGGMALAQPKPLAWISTGPARMIHWTADKPAYGDDWVPLYNTPPQRTWVGLTLTQVKLLWEGVQEEAVKSGDSLNWVFYTHINEALKEKNT